MISRREVVTFLGGLTASPLAARAQQAPRAPAIGALMPLTEADPEGQARQAAFEAGLKEAGYVRGQNLAIEYRFVAAQFDRLPALVADLIRRQVAVIVTPGSSPAALAAKAATASIPIVLSMPGDPVQAGPVASLNRPGGNVTGVSYVNNELAAKRLGLLRDVIRGIDLVAVLVDPVGPPAQLALRDVEAAAAAIGQRILVLQVAGSRDIDAAFATLATRRAGAIMVLSGNSLTLARTQIVNLAAQHAIPAIYGSREYVEAGGLMSYAASLRDAYRLVGIYTGRILKGERPADLPVQQSTKIDFVINLKTAKALGLEIPSGISAIADEVIE
jgi:putative ABC transport system substrate-binding protein